MYHPTERRRAKLSQGQLNVKVNNTDMGQNYIPPSGAKRGIASDSHRCWRTLHGARNFEKRILQDGADGPPFLQVAVGQVRHMET